MAAAAGHDAGLPLHRIEALTDGIFAVAMTLLVIEPKLPEHGAAESAEALSHALVELLPKAFAWLSSFFVLPVPAMGNAAFMLMAVVSPLSRRIERSASTAPVSALAPAEPT